MSLQSVLVRVTFVAPMTDEGFPHGVGAIVSVQAVFVSKRCTTKVALIRPLPAVNLQVTFQVAALFELFITKTALVFFVGSLAYRHVSYCPLILMLYCQRSRICSRQQN